MDLPKEFDIVVLGTGLTETIAAAAFSRIGLKVLHIDRNEHYGGSFANFSLNCIEKWEKDLQELQTRSQIPEEEISKLLEEGEILITLPPKHPLAHHIKEQFNVRHRTAEEIEAAERSKASQNVWRFAPSNITSDETRCATDKEESDSLPNTENTEKDFTEQTTSTTADDMQGTNGKETKDKEDEGKQKGQEENEESSSKASNDVEPPENSLSSDALPNITDSEKTTDNDENMTGNSTKDDEKETDPAKDQVSDDSGTCASAVPETVRQEWTVEGIQDEGRRFCFDISPRVLYCSGDLVELLIRSDVARYCEFRTVSRVLTPLKGSLEQVPCSRADVFGSKIVSLIEKRLMMKFLQFAMDFESSPDEYKDYIDKPFCEFLSSKKLSANVKHFIQNAIAMVSDSVTTQEGLKKTQLFLRSLGRYANSAFLFPLYGSGELPQAFSRLSAVFGGIYCLKFSASHIVMDKEKKCSGIITSEGQKIACRYLIAEASYLPSSHIDMKEKRTTARAIYMTDKSICPSDEDELSLLNFICEDDKRRPVTVLELPYTASVCPKGVFVVHLTRESNSEDDAEIDFAEVKEKLFGDGTDETKPKILWSYHFYQPDLSQVLPSEDVAENVLITSAGGDNVVDMEKIVDEAKSIFQKVCPDEEFLAKPPDPEDIIWVDDKETSASGNKAEDDTKDEKNENNGNKDPSDEKSSPEQSECKESTTEVKEEKKLQEENVQEE